MTPPKNQRLRSPLFDRLLSQGTESKQAHQVLKQLRESVRRDLESLFNTRFRCVSPPSSMPHLNDSILNFGLPDLSSINLTSIDSRKQFCSDIEKTILKFEPRIQRVKVSSTNRIDNEDPAIRFRVEATLHANPAPELIIFDSTLNPINQTVDVTEI